MKNKLVKESLKYPNTQIGELAKALLEDDYDTMFSFVPEGVEHRGDVYKSSEDFEWNDHEEYIRYILPAIRKLEKKILQLILNEVEETY